MKWIALAVPVALTLCLRASAGEAPAADKAATVSGDTAFALNLYAHLRTQQGNLFLSPYSLSSALAMTYAGAEGNTKAQMEKALHLSLPPDRLHAAYAARLQALTAAGDKRPYALTVANALWGQEGYAWKPAFLETNKSHYGAGVRAVNFSKTESARTEINQWVEEQTRDKIKDLMPAGSITALTRMVLTNAIYFKGTWLAPFKARDTQPGEFHLSATETVRVPLMHQSGDFKLFENDDLQALELPYVGRDLSMVVLLPRQRTGLAKLEAALSVDRLQEWLIRLRPVSDVDVTLPRFKATGEFSLKDALTALGMKDAFIDGTADFSGMTTGEKLHISAVIHKAFVDVNEEGTEATAATGVVATGRSARVNPVFRADHPFLFLIKENRSGAILFLGRMANPK